MLRLITLQLEDTEVNKLCHASVDLNARLCADEFFWREKVRKFAPEKELKKPNWITWKKYYKNMTLSNNFAVYNISLGKYMIIWNVDLSAPFPIALYKARSIIYHVVYLHPDGSYRLYKIGDNLEGNPEKTPYFNVNNELNNMKMVDDTDTIALLDNVRRNHPTRRLPKGVTVINPFNGLALKKMEKESEIDKHEISKILEEQYGITGVL